MTTDNQIDRFYVGEDFSGFFYERKTGNFGLRSLEATGAFDATVTEEFLQSKFFVKESL